MLLKDGTGFEDNLMLFFFFTVCSSSSNLLRTSLAFYSQSKLERKDPKDHKILHRVQSQFLR